MATIKVPKPPRSAFNPDRPASDLLRNQVNHLEWAVRHAGQRRAGYTVKKVKTEGDVASRMKQLIPQLESAANLPMASTPLVEAPPPKRAAKRRAKRPVTKRARKAQPKRTAKPKRRTRSSKQGKRKR